DDVQITDAESPTALENAEQIEDSTDQFTPHVADEFAPTEPPAEDIEAAQEEVQPPVDVASAEPFPIEAPAEEAIETSDDVQATDAEPSVALENTEHVEDSTDQFTPQAVEESAVEADVSNYDPDLLEIFLEEAEEIQENAERVIVNWSGDRDNLEHVAELQRLLHTLKGGARMANVVAVGDLSHAMESLLERITEGHLQPVPEHPELIQTCHDWLTGGLEQARKLLPTETPHALVTQIDAAIRGETFVADPVSGEAATEEPAAIEASAEAEALSPPVEIKMEAAPEPLSEVETEEITFVMPEAADRSISKKVDSSDEQVRVRADLLNELVNFSGEINIYNARIAQQLGTSRFNLAELQQTVLRLQEQLRKFEIETEAQIMYRHETTVTPGQDDFDPLEMDRFSTMQQLSRGMVESLGDLVSIQSMLENLSGETDVLLLQQNRITGELYEGLMRTRMVAFSTVLPRLRRILRQTAKETGKQAEFLITGGEGELDRTQLNRLVPALEHILRNAIDHGLESPEQRQQIGKPASGSVHLHFAQQGSEVVLTISDDGAGINIDMVREKAIEKGRMLADADLSDQEIVEFILESGFTTATEVTQISGRGVGLDVANTEIKQLGGTLHIHSKAGKGTKFTLRLPLTVLVNQALLVQVADSTYAIQLPNVEHVVRLGYDELLPLSTGEISMLEYADNQYRYLNLGTVLHGQPPQMPTDRGRVPLMLIRSGDHRIALHVDTLLGRQEIVIKSVGPQLSSVGILSGATILPDGEVALILDVPNLVRSALAQLLDDAAPLLPTVEETARVEKIPTIMVVDDSITVRKVTERLLKRYDYNVITAKDGVDALTIMLEQVPDTMLLDVEMPRMDGYELATTMRNDERLKSIPIIMITSRTGEKHRKRALDIGVNKYMGKPYQEQELIANIQLFTDESSQ
ncbi:MAG: response regulator, partial [Gammaproteobacteria bacterium]|nr:response regulator [Gammaproteobacteria bacterium]